MIKISEVSSNTIPELFNMNVRTIVETFHEPEVSLIPETSSYNHKMTTTTKSP